RLAGRGLTLSGVALTALLSRHATAAGMTGLLVDTTVRSAMLVAEGTSVAGVVSAPTAALTEGVLRTMLVTKLKIAAAVVLALSLLGTGVGFSTYHALATERVDTVKPNLLPYSSEPEYRDGDRFLQVLVPSPRDGILSMIGTEIREGEKVPPDQRVYFKY